ncbi:unnamed protein product [Brachionus calyciflorus]|uniref:MULE transposase domain-containing protein n=1 Tax=Brachionus calyciflorus TaxID=104777 RepID=A0A814K0I4_9BILA|nr:unnamed protein product [Brachionus calyciflorus]
MNLIRDSATNLIGMYIPFVLMLSTNVYLIYKVFESKLAEIVYNKLIDPRIIIADNAGAISNGFEQVFVCEKRINCWAHFIRKIDSRLRMFEDDFRKKIRSDILLNDAVKLFVLKYKRFKNAALNDFLSYFENEWVKKNSGWYEGYAIGMPSTTNGLLKP